MQYTEKKDLEMRGVGNGECARLGWSMSSNAKAFRPKGSSGTMAVQTIPAPHGNNPRDVGAGRTFQSNVPASQI